MSYKWTVWKCELLLIPLWFFLSSIFLSFPPFFSPSFISSFFFFLPTCVEHLRLQGSGSWPLGTCVGLHTVQVSYSCGGGFLHSLRIKKQRPGAISFILNDHAFLPPKPLNTQLFFPVILCRTQKINHKLISTLVSGRKHLGADKIQFN